MSESYDGRVPLSWATERGVVELLLAKDSVDPVHRWFRSYCASTDEEFHEATRGSYGLITNRPMNRTLEGTRAEGDDWMNQHSDSPIAVEETTRLLFSNRQTFSSRVDIKLADFGTSKHLS
jgi:hypothetical protein